MQNIHPETIQSVMRHKSITLTMSTYGHLFPGVEPAAIQTLSTYLNPRQSQRDKATPAYDTLPPPTKRRNHKTTPRSATKNVETRKKKVGLAGLEPAT